MADNPLVVDDSFVGQTLVVSTPGGSNVPARAVVAPSGTAFYQTVQDHGAPVPQQPAVNFTGPGVSVSNGPGSVTTVTIAGTTQAAVTVFPLSLGEQPAAPWGGPDGSTGNTYLAFALAQEDTPVTQMVCMCDQGGGTAAGFIRMGIFDVLGNRIADTTAMPGPIGVGTITLPITTPITLTRGSRYYFALFCSLNGVQFLQVSNKYGGANPVIAYLAVNTLGLPVVAVPGNPQSVRFYVGAIA